MVPIGFVSDHMEVIYDLDTEAMATAERLGMRAVRAATSGTDPRFVAMVRDLVLERAAAERGESPVRPAVGSLPAGARRLRGGLLPQPAWSAPGPLRARLVTVAPSDAPEDLRDLARALAHEGADLAREMRRGGIDVADTKTSAVDVVTEADRAVEELLRSRIVAQRPDDAILGEEGDDRPGTSGVRWVLDPIDGTVNYLYGLPDCAVSVAAEVDGRGGRGRRGHDPDRCGVRRGARARRRRATACRSRVRPSPPLAERLVLTGFGYQREVREHQAGCVAALLPEVRDIRRMGSCALDLCHVADGSGDGYVEAGPQAVGLVRGRPRAERGRRPLRAARRHLRARLAPGPQRGGGRPGRRVGRLRRSARRGRLPRLTARPWG